MTALLTYKPAGATLKAFMLSETFFRGLRGPVGSGKSACCCIEIFRRALAQQRGPGGKRQSRWAVIRNSYPELRTTTLATWKSWFPEDVWGKVTMHPPPYTHRLRKGDLDLEVLFLALDRPEDVKKLLSLELTGVWVNEAREIPKSIIDACTMRVGRYPSMKDGGPSWYGVICDTNAPDDDHWWSVMSGEAPVPEHFSREEALMLIKPDNWSFHTQPGGMVEEKDPATKEVTGYAINPDAENLKNLTPGYYPSIIKGKSKDWIGVYVLNRLGALSDGRPVFPDFDPKLHLSVDPLHPMPGIPIHCGVDFGLTPAAVFAQQLRGRWLVLGELVATDMGTTKFGPLLKKELASRFPTHKVIVTGDPAGDYRAQTDESTPFQLLRAAGIVARPAATNDVSVRIGVVEQVLTRLVDRTPGLLVDPSAVHIRRGFEGGYHYRRLQVAGAERFEDAPHKNKFSHPMDALQYLLLGGGESRAILHGGTAAKPRNARAPYDPFAQRRRIRGLA
jgi:hypothetical protein